MAHDIRALRGCPRACDDRRMRDPALAAELVARMELDQQARRALDEGHELSNEGEAVQRVFEIDRDNTAWLRGVLAGGWPGRTKVGEDGARAAWLLCQHADRDRALQQRALALLEAAVAEGDAPEPHLAYLTDRVLVAEGRKQRYGTQVLSVGSDMWVQPIEEPDGLDQRRAEMGLEPFEEYERLMRSRFP
jgi:hypothetical protein